jgi:glucokinase
MAYTVVAIDIGGTKLACGLVRLEAGAEPVVYGVEKVPTDAPRGGAAVLASVIDLALAALERAEEPVVGMGISSAGVIDVHTGAIAFANDLMPGWMGTPLGQRLAEATGLDVRVLNDVHAHALGEARHGAGKDYASSLVVAVGTGIGSAFVDNGMLMLGAHGVAGHVGHVQTPEAVGIPCSCGCESHVEPVAAGPGIIEEFVRLGGPSVREDGVAVDGAYIEQLAQAGDERACAAEAKSARALGGVLGSLVNVLDPACVIVSGSVAKCGPTWHEPLHAAFEAQAMGPCRSTPIVHGALGDNAPLIGAAEHFIAPAYRELLG